MTTSYKKQLEKSKNIYDIQNAYEEECYRRTIFLLEKFPEDFESDIVRTFYDLGHETEIYIVSQFGALKNHSIKQKI